jgi:hypothetical protein
VAETMYWRYRSLSGFGPSPSTEPSLAPQPEYDSRGKGVTCCATHKRLSKTMTIREAAAVWNNPRADFLDRWAGMFAIRLEEIRPEHIAEYQNDRARESPQCMVDVELRALNALLKDVGLDVL